MSKSVGIVNLYYKTYNYGAQLQCYALQRVITDLGYETEIVRFRWYMTWLERFYKQEAGAGNYDKFEAFAKNIPHSRRVYTPENIRECVDDYDIFVCGSDQIWGVSYSMPCYVLPQITLSFVPGSKIKIAYGISMGGATVPDAVKLAINKSVRELDAVSVREKSAVSFVSSITDKPISDVLDPTMLLDALQWDEIAVSPDSADNYIFLYNIGGNEQLEAAAKLLSERFGCEIKSISYSPIDTIGPLEFIGFIKHAKYVLTNSYHGTIFSILYNKQFWAFTADDLKDEYSKNIRMTDLLKSLGLLERFVHVLDIGINLEQAIDYALVIDSLKQSRNKSLEYLKASLGLQKNTADRKTGDVLGLFSDTPDPIKDYLESAAICLSEPQELNYERRLVEKDLEIERLSRELYTEETRNDIYCKLLRFQSFGLLLDYDPLLQGQVVIYGVGKLGRLASMCFESNLLCFVDSNSNDESFRSYPIYKLSDERLHKLTREYEKITFLVTPLIEYDSIESELEIFFPDCSVVSVEKLVGKIENGF